MKSITKTNKGITLIALVITIIVLLILAGVSIATLTGQNGVLNKASKAKEEHLIEQYKEEINLIIIDEIAERKIEIKQESLIKSLDTKIREKEWVNEIYKCDENGMELEIPEQSTHLLIETKEQYEILVEVDESTQTAQIVSSEKGTGEKYKITYNANGGVGEEYTTEIRPKTFITLKECSYTKKDYKFVGWSESPIGEGVRYLANAKYKPTGNTILYATWESTLVTVTFNSNNGKSEIKQVQVSEGIDTKLPTNSFQKEGYDFVEWNTKADGTGTKYKEGANINTTENVNLYAIWKKHYYTDGSWDVDKLLNTPKLASGMTAVYWDNSGKEVTNDSGANWYNYVAGNNSTDTKTSKWANAKTSDGSYWVWIPRYEYKILSGEGTGSVGKIEVKFIPITQTKADSGYKIHPCFQNGASNNYKRGEWDKELSGIWVAKCEASRSNATASSAGSSSVPKFVLGVPSWRGGMTIANMYSTALNYDSSKGSHMMKNSEWGAVAYLTHSQYGRNGKEIDVNNSYSFITGNGGGSTSAGQITGIANAYNTVAGARASTTGNITGIYDMSGGTWEYTAAFVNTGDSNLSINGGGLLAGNSKYVTVYQFSSYESSPNYVAYRNAGYGYGDAILETSGSASTSGGWFSDESDFPAGIKPFFIRGGACGGMASSGIFNFAYDTGGAGPYVTFRIVLAF